MRGQRGHGALEDPGVDEIDLAAAALLGRGADELDPDPEPVRLAGGHQERADIGHRDQVVTAGVTDVGKRVVFREERDRWAFRPDMGAEGGRDAAQVPLDAEAVPLEKAANAIDGATLLVGGLGIGVDLARQRQEVLAEIGLGSRGHVPSP